MENQKKGKSLILLYKLASSMVLIWFFFEIILFSLYLIGNYQQFLDKTQLLILKVLSYSSFITFVLCFISLAILVLLIVTKIYKKSNFLRLFLILLSLTVNLVFLSYSTIISKLSEGI